jgi:hypothetical protein
MPDIEIWTDEGADDDENERRANWPAARQPATRRFTVVVAAIAAAVAIVVCVVVVRHGDGRRAPVAQPAATTAVPTAAVSSAATPAPVSTGLDVLDYTGVFVESGSLGSAEVTYVFGLVNETAETLPILYPIRIVGRDNVEIVPVFAGIYDHQIATAHMNDFLAPADRLTSFAPVAAESLLVRLRIDCDNRAMAAISPSDQPRIIIRLGGVDEPASFSFADLANGFVDAFRQDCG